MQLELYYPVTPMHVNQGFGGSKAVYSQFGLEGHNGIDFMASHGQPVYAAHDGTCFPEVDKNQGNGVVIRTDQAYDYNGQPVHFKTIYWHLMDAFAVVKPGQKVKAGECIGYADSTGFSTGDHLHFGLKPQAWNEENWTWLNTDQNNGYAGSIDPTPYFNGKYASLLKPTQRFYFNKDLSKWSMGRDVQELQKLLGVPQTGFFWTLTYNAVVAYQKSKGLPQTGFVGSLTRAALNS